MRVKMLTSRALANGQTQQWGDEVDMDRDEAKRLIAAQQAVAVAETQTQRPTHGPKTRG